MSAEQVTKAPAISSRFNHVISENLHVRFHQVNKKIVDLGHQIRQETGEMKNQMYEKLQELENEKMEIFKLLNNDKNPFGSMYLSRSNHYLSQITPPPVFVSSCCQLERYAYDVQKKAFLHMDACQRVKLVQMFPNLCPAHRSTNMNMGSLELHRLSLVLDQTTLKFGIARYAINRNPHEKFENPFAESNENGGLYYDIGKFADEDGMWAQDQKETRKELEEKRMPIHNAEQELGNLLKKLKAKLYVDEKEKKSMEDKVEKLRAKIMHFRERKAKFELEYETKIQLTEIKHMQVISRQYFPYDCSLNLKMACFMEDSIGGKLKSHIQTDRFTMMEHNVLLPETTTIRIPNPDSEVQVRNGSIESIRIGQTVIRNPIDPLFKVQSDLMWLEFRMHVDMLDDTVDSFLSVVSEPIPPHAMERITRGQLPIKFKMPFTSTMSLRIEISLDQDIITVVVCGRPRNWAMIKEEQRRSILNREEMDLGRRNGFRGDARSIAIFARYLRLSLFWNQF